MESFKTCFNIFRNVLFRPYRLDGCIPVVPEVVYYDLGQTNSANDAESLVHEFLNDFILKKEV